MSYHSTGNASNEQIAQIQRGTVGNYAGNIPGLVAPTLGSVAVSKSAVDDFNALGVRLFAPFLHLLSSAPGLSAALKNKLRTRPFDALVDLFDPIEEFVSLTMRDYIKKTGKLSVTMPISGQRVFLRGGSYNNATGKVYTLPGDAALTRADPSGMNLVRRLRVINAFMATFYCDPIGLLGSSSLVPTRNDFGELHTIGGGKVPTGVPVRDHRVTQNDTEQALRADGWSMQEYIPGKIRVEIWTISRGLKSPKTGKVQKGDYNESGIEFLYYFHKLDMMKSEAEKRRESAARFDAANAVAVSVYGGRAVLPSNLVLRTGMKNGALGSLGEVITGVVVAEKTAEAVAADMIFGIPIAEFVGGVIVSITTIITAAITTAGAVIIASGNKTQADADPQKGGGTNGEPTFDPAGDDSGLRREEPSSSISPMVLLGGAALVGVLFLSMRKSK